MFRCPSRGEGVRCAVFLYQKTDERSQFLIFQSSLHSLPYIKTLLFVLCDFGHYFLCKKIYPISVFWFFFFLILATELLASVLFIQHCLGNYCPWDILMSVKQLVHSAVWNSLSSTDCQHCQSAMDSHSKELSHHITHSSHMAISHFIISLELPVGSTRDSNERKQAVKHLPIF